MSELLRVVFDCNVYLQALANPEGPAGRCVELALAGQVALYLSPQVLDEIRDVTSRPRLIARFKLREERVAALLENLQSAAVVVPAVAEVWTCERDPDDAHYVNLALAVNARLIVSRDKDLLDLMNPATPEGKKLMAEHPDFRVLTPPAFLEVVEQGREM